jgi:hypothetical protein
MAVPKRVVVFSSDQVIEDRQSLQQLINTFARGVWKDFKTTNKHTAGKATKLAAGVAAGATVAKHFQVYTPLQWALRGFGPLPVEFTKSGAIQVFEYTTVQRALRVGGAALAKFVLVTVAYEGGVLIGSVINQTLSEETKDAIGGTIDEIVNHGGWRLLYQHPFGIGM